MFIFPCRGLESGGRGEDAAGAATPHFAAGAVHFLRRGGKGWLSTLRGDPTKRPRRADDDGTPLNDEVLLVIFAGVHNLADLVRCAATCRRWRRLVSAEAAFICRTSPRLVPARFIGPLALGFFHHHQADAAPGFVAMASASRRFPGILRNPPLSLGALVDDGLFDGSSRIVAARNGLLVVDIGHGKKNRALKLCVCNPMTGQVHVLPPLAGKDGLGHYACTVLTAEDRDDKATDPPPPPTYFRLVMVYSRRGFTAFRSYSSDEGSWSEEAKLTCNRLGKKQMGLTHSGVVSRDGERVYWMANNVVLVLDLNNLQSILIYMPRSGNDMKNTLLGLSPKGWLCAVHFNPLPARMKALYSISIRVTTSTEARWFYNTEWFQVGQSLPNDWISLKLRWFCGKSGIVFFSVVAGDTGHRRSELYALSLNTRSVEKLASHDGEGDLWEGLHGYEMDQVAYLATLAEPDCPEDI